MMEAFISGLPNAVNRELIDKAAIDFVTNLNTADQSKEAVESIQLIYDLFEFCN